MKKYFLLMGTLLLALLNQSHAAALCAPEAPAPAAAVASSTFLDGLDSQVNADTFMMYVAPFSILTIGTKSTADAPAVTGIGEASRGLSLISSGYLEESRKPLIQTDLANGIAALANPKTFDVTIAGSVERRSWHAHTVSPLDIRIAEALYGLISKEGVVWEGYYQVEAEVWRILPGILRISTVPSEVDPKNLAAMDLWTFLTATVLHAWAYDPPVERLAKPPYASGAAPSTNMDFLATTFKRFIEAYEKFKT